MRKHSLRRNVGQKKTRTETNAKGSGFNKHTQGTRIGVVWDLTMGKTKEKHKKKSQSSPVLFDSLPKNAQHHMTL